MQRAKPAEPRLLDAKNGRGLSLVPIGILQGQENVVLRDGFGRFQLFCLQGVVDVQRSVREGLNVAVEVAYQKDVYVDGGAVLLVARQLCQNLLNQDLGVLYDRDVQCVPLPGFLTEFPAMFFFFGVLNPDPSLMRRDPVQVLLAFFGTGLCAGMRSRGYLCAADGTHKGSGLVKFIVIVGVLVPLGFRLPIEFPDRRHIGVPSFLHDVRAPAILGTARPDDLKAFEIVRILDQHHRPADAASQGPA